MKAIACAIMLLSMAVVINADGEKEPSDMVVGFVAYWFLGWTLATIYFLVTP